MTVDEAIVEVKRVACDLDFRHAANPRAGLDVSAQAIRLLMSWANAREAQTAHEELSVIGAGCGLSPAPIPLTAAEREGVEAAIADWELMGDAEADEDQKIGYLDQSAALRRALAISDALPGLVAELQRLTAPPSADAREETRPFDLRTHLQRQREFSERTFGPGRRTAGVVQHIRKELIEIEADPDDVSEWIDVAILALDGAWRAGYSPEQIIAALVAKQTKNETREWPDWRTFTEGQAIEHVRAEAAPPPHDEPETPRSLVAGETMTISIADFVRRCEALLDEEQRRANPSNALIGCLCEAVRLAREVVVRQALGDVPAGEQ